MQRTEPKTVPPTRWDMVADLERASARLVALEHALLRAQRALDRPATDPAALERALAEEAPPALDDIQRELQRLRDAIPQTDCGMVEGRAG